MLLLYTRNAHEHWSSISTYPASMRYILVIYKPCLNALNRIYIHGSVLHKFVNTETFPILHLNSSIDLCVTVQLLFSILGKSQKDRRENKLTFLASNSHSLARTVTDRFLGFLLISPTFYYKILLNIVNIANIITKFNSVVL